MTPSPEMLAFATGFPLTLLHAGITLGFLLLGLAVYSLLSPHREIGQIRNGNPAAALSLAGLILGFAIPLASALAASPSALEVALWAGAVVLVDLILFRVIDMLLSGLPDRVKEGDVPAAALLSGAKLGAAIILAAAVAG